MAASAHSASHATWAPGTTPGPRALLTAHYPGCGCFRSTEAPVKPWRALRVRDRGQRRPSPLVCTQGCLLLPQAAHNGSRGAEEVRQQALGLQSPHRAAASGRGSEQQPAGLLGPQETVPSRQHSCCLTAAAELAANKGSTMVGAAVEAGWQRGRQRQRQRRRRQRQPFSSLGAVAADDMAVAPALLLGRPILPNGM